ncbi:MAG: YdcF family protein [Christensenellales bacterium]|nr:YdcF family protein [Christensenellales bacterium]
MRFKWTNGTEFDVGGKGAKAMNVLRRLLMVLAALVLLGAVCAAGLVGFVYYKETHLPPVGEFDTIIVLGAQVKADGTPSVALERRLTAALEEYRKQPRLMIVCGAQGSDEPRAEGDVMRDWLIAHGVAAADIEAETDSFNTRQNLGYAQSIMDDRGLTAALIVTSDYHVPRALALCEQVGIIASGKGSPSKPEYFIKNHLREGLSWIKFVWESRHE